MPAVRMLTGGVDVSDKFVALDGNEYASLQAAKEAGAAVLGYGAFIQSVIDFLIIAFAIFVAVKAMNTMMKKREEQPAPAGPPADIKLLTEIRDALTSR